MHQATVWAIAVPMILLAALLLIHFVWGEPR